MFIFAFLRSCLYWAHLWYCRLFALVYNYLIDLHWVWIVWVISGILHWTTLIEFYLSFFTIWLSKLQHFVKDWKKESWTLNLCLSYFREMDKFYSFWSCLVIIVINICVMVLRENLFVAGISIPLQSDLQSRINTIFIQDNYVASYLAYGTEGVVRIYTVKKGSRVSRLQPECH